MLAEPSCRQVAGNGSGQSADAGELEADDQLMSLPESGEPSAPAQQDNGRPDAGRPAGEPADFEHFNRLHPNRRSFSTPAVNTLPGSPNRPRAPPAEQPAAGSQAGDCKLRARRRTALGLISLGSANFRLGAQQPSGGPKTTSWRTWFTIGGPSTCSNHKQARKFLLRNLKARGAAQATDLASATSLASLAAEEPRPEIEKEPENEIGKTLDERRRQQTGDQDTLSAADRGQVGKTKAELDIQSARLPESSQKQEILGPEEDVGPSLKSGDSGELDRPKEEMRLAELNRPASLVDQLVDSELDWRTLMKKVNERLEGWSLDQVGELELKRQEVMHELIQTERHHCLTLALMRQVYLAGVRQLNELRSTRALSHPQPEVGGHQGDQVDLERLFPALEDLIQVHELFFAHLRLKLVDSCQERGENQPVGLVGSLAELLRDQFSLEPKERAQVAGEAPELPATSTSAATTLALVQSQKRSRHCKQSSASNGQKLLQAYAKFCGQHYDSSRYYKHLMASDKGFRQFIESCNKQNPACRQRGIPECNLLVTQRLTKYPLLIEQLIKTSKDNPEEEARLKEALAECRKLLAELNDRLARKESFERLLDIYAQFCPKSYTIYNRHLRFTKHDLLQHKRLRQLIHSDGQIRIWSATRRKLFQVLCLILNDIVVFLRIEPAAPFSPASGPELSSPPASAGSLAGPSAAAHCSGSPTHPAQSPVWSSLGAGATLAGQEEPAGEQQSSSALISAVASSSPAQAQYCVKYYFANIDNKSSVISLGKLLIREKAVNDNEPRIYMISSSPRQPEMYELAFVSKRHQTSFVDKLKSSIELYNKSTELLDEQLEDFDDDLDEFAALTSSEQLNLVALEDDCEGQDDANSSTGSSNALRGNCTFESDDELDVGFEDVQTSQIREQAQNCSDQEELEEGPEVKQPVDSLLAVSASDNEASSSTGRAADESILTESGLSERAKDSMDEATPGRQKLRGQRRRRIQRPRNVSNQSSSSEEATAHRQAMELISSSPQKSSPAPATSSESPSKQPAEAGAKVGADEEFDSGRGQDDYSSAASTSSNSLESRLVRNESRSLANQTGSNLPESSLETLSGEPKKKRSSLTNKSLSTSSILSSLTSGNCTTDIAEQDKQEQTISSNQNSLGQASLLPVVGASLVKCSSSILSAKPKASSSFTSKQRKLSTVSTMSSQLKLLNKLKSSGLLGSGQAVGQSLCPQCCYLFSTGGKTNSTTHNNDTNTDHQQNQQQQEQLQRQQQQLSTLSKQMRQQIRRSSFIPEQKLEELRDLRIQLDKDKQEWQQKFDGMQEQLLNERRELDLAREKLKQDRQQVANEREQLYRKLDLLKEKGILLSPSHKVIITAPELRLYNPNCHTKDYGLSASCAPCAPNHHKQQQQQHQFLSQQHQHQQQYIFSQYPVQNSHHRQSQCNIPQASHLNELQKAHTNHSSTSNLYLQTPPKVPLHLSQQGNAASSSPVRQALTFGSYKVPLIGSISGSLLGARNSVSSKISGQDPRSVSHAF